MRSFTQSERDALLFLFKHSNASGVAWRDLHPRHRAGIMKLFKRYKNGGLIGFYSMQDPPRRRPKRDDLKQPERLHFGLTFLGVQTVNFYLKSLKESA